MKASPPAGRATAHNLVLADFPALGAMAELARKRFDQEAHARSQSMENNASTARYMVRCFGRALALKTAKNRASRPPDATDWTAVAATIETITDDHG